jgi:hypothetical protein
MLFNKNDNGQQELKALLGFLYASNTFANIKTDVMLVEEDVIELIGQAVYDRALAYYKSNDYDPDGDALNDKLVQHIQLPVAYYASGKFAAHTDIGHGEDGRKVKIDNANEKLPWEWMISRDDNAMLNKAHKTMDRLIAFLEKNSTDITEWKDSSSQKIARSLFINNTKTFNDIFPIDNSRRFFIKIIPFIKEVERKHLLPVLGKTRYDDIKAALLSGDYTDEEDLLQLIRVPLVFFALNLAVKRLSVRLLPNGIFQDYTSDRHTKDAKNSAPTQLVNSIANMLYSDAEFELQNLQKKISKLDAEAINEEYVPVKPNAHLDADKPIFRL